MRFHLSNFVRNHGVNNVFFLDTQERLFCLPGERRPASNRPVVTLLRLDESSDKISDNYKINLEPMINGFSNLRTYLSDFETLVQEDCIRPVIRVETPVTEGRLDLLNQDGAYFLMDGHIPKKVLCFSRVPKDSVGTPALFVIMKVKGNFVQLSSICGEYADVKLEKAELVALINSGKVQSFVPAKTPQSLAKAS